MYALVKTSKIILINYTISELPATLLIYNISGEVIKKYENLEGSGSLTFDGSKLPCGIYFYKLFTQGNFEITKKMIIMR